jgi:hypothetical protein
MGAVAGWRRFWLSAAFHSVVAQVIHGVGGSMCAMAVGAARSAAPEHGGRKPVEGGDRADAELR